MLCTGGNKIISTQAHYLGGKAFDVATMGGDIV